MLPQSCWAFLYVCEAAHLCENFSMLEWDILLHLNERIGETFLLLNTITRIHTVLRGYKDTQRSESEPEPFLIFSNFFLRVAHRKEKGRGQTAESRCGLTGTRCLALEALKVFLLSTGPWYPAMTKPLSTPVVACTEHSSSGPELL